jgi:hypothetical protein
MAHRRLRQGADEDLMSFYSTTASTSWKAPRIQRDNQALVPSQTDTGYIKNCGRLQPPKEPEDADRFQSAYKRLHTEANTVIRKSASECPAPAPRGLPPGAHPRAAAPSRAALHGR